MPDYEALALTAVGLTVYFAATCERVVLSRRPGRIALYPPPVHRAPPRSWATHGLPRRRRRKLPLPPWVRVSLAAFGSAYLQ